MQIEASHVREIFTKVGASHLVDHALSLAEMACDLLPTPAEKEPPILRGSRIGGSPDLPPRMTWPRRGSGRWLTFMAQVSLDEAAAAGVELYGGTGLLSFFFDHDRFAGVGTGSLSEYDCFQVLYFPLQAELVTTPRPKPLRDPNPSPFPTLPHAKVALRPTLTIPDQAPRELSDSDRTLWGAGVRDLAYLRRTPSHRLGGYATSIQGSAESGCAMYRYGHAPMAPDSNHPARKECEEYARAWRLLLQLDSDDACNLQFDTDLGRLFFCVRPSTPPFDHLWAITQGS